MMIYRQHIYIYKLNKLYLCGHDTSIFIYVGTALQYLHYESIFLLQWKKNQFSNEMYIKWTCFCHNITCLFTDHCFGPFLFIKIYEYFHPFIRLICQSNKPGNIVIQLNIMLHLHQWIKLWGVFGSIYLEVIKIFFYEFSCSTCFFLVLKPFTRENPCLSSNFTTRLTFSKPPFSL